MAFLAVILSIIVLIILAFMLAFYDNHKDNTEYIVKVYGIFLIPLLLFILVDLTSIYYIINPIVKGTYIKTSIYENDVLEVVSYSKCKKIALGTNDCTIFKKIRRKVTKTYGDPVTELFEIKEN